MLLGALVALGGCAGMGSMADVLTVGSGSRDISGEVRRVDERNRTIQVSNWYGSSSVRYDNRTRVSGSGRSMSVRSIDRGDRVSIQVQRNNRGDMYARSIRVERGRHTSRNDDRRNDDRRNARVSYVEGRVHRIEQRAGWMEVRPSRGSTIRVSLPGRADSREVNAFRRIRRGDHVRIQARPLRGNRMEIVRIL